ncbi:UNVERIFIED_CONTAM: rhoptry protein ROP1 [Hammondia hammondi]|eukprot:XP_008886492.1 rhoptry protein ROP1 [Hammondia hammondi]
MEQRLPIVLLLLSVILSSTPSAVLSSHNGVPAYPSYAQVSLSANSEPRRSGKGDSFLMPVKPHANADDFASDDNDERLPSFVEAPVERPRHAPATGEAASGTEESLGEQPPVSLGGEEGEGSSIYEAASEGPGDDGDQFHDALQELPHDGLDAPPPAAQELPPPAEQELPPPAEQELPPPAEQELPPPAEQELPPPGTQEPTFVHGPPSPVARRPPLSDMGSSGGGEGQGPQVPEEHGPEQVLGPQGPPDDEQQPLLQPKEEQEQQEGAQEPLPPPPPQGKHPEGQQPQPPVRQNLFRRALGAVRARFGAARRHVGVAFRRVRSGLNRAVGGVSRGFRRVREGVVGGVSRVTGGASQGLRRVRTALGSGFNRLRGVRSGGGRAADDISIIRERLSGASGRLSGASGRLSGASGRLGGALRAVRSGLLTGLGRRRRTSGEEDRPLLREGREQDDGSQ